jgi:hypothetical protein
MGRECPSRGRGESVTERETGAEANGQCEDLIWYSVPRCAMVCQTLGSEEIRECGRFGRRLSAVAVIVVTGHRGPSHPGTPSRGVRAGTVLDCCSRSGSRGCVLAIGWWQQGTRKRGGGNPNPREIKIPINSQLQPYNVTWTPNSKKDKKDSKVFAWGHRDICKGSWRFL